MSTENTTNDGTPEQSLEDFASELFGGSDNAPDNAKSEETTEDDAEVNGESDSTDTLEDTQTDDTDDEEAGDVSEDDDTLATDEDEETDEADDVDQKPKKKNRFQERIDELTAARKEAERKVEQERLEYEKRIARLEAKLEGNTDGKKSTDTEPTNKPSNDGPSAIDPDAKNEDGTKKYPLGQYDPQYLRDTVEAMFEAKKAEAEKEQQLTEQQRQKLEVKEALQGQWNEKLVDAQERYPDFREKGEQMLTVFEGIDEQYGEYLTDTLMEMDNGPDVFYYLANNVEEAQKIVSAGPKRATMALAKLEAQLGGGGGKPRSANTKKVSQAKEPPPRNRGSAIAKPKVAADTDDLDAFQRELFRK